ncbi:hypothetical protein Cflav_PD6214 [Pedosphaera parvula Ellin514]|uniref:Uncharacterized protein n=1 Tax=Pedosphaera parvula (strain Ellin514) TaxID=320771 RepID=B9XHP5_PEDPL|nr:hypothetical protein Cflav_PD6214 [Pedosphaera parvula Ellin514]
MPNDRTSATAAMRRADCNGDGPPPFAAAHGLAAVFSSSPLLLPPSGSYQAAYTLYEKKRGYRKKNQTHQTTCRICNPQAPSCEPVQTKRPNMRTKK